METIAPLARVLAEANGIEWRSLHGTGESGIITEDDILIYLARVMSGEEDAPLTPVDPEPSPAELAAYSSPEMLSRAGVEPELAEFLKAQQDEIHIAAAPAAPVQVASVAAPDVAPAAQPAPAEDPEPIAAEPVFVPEEILPEPLAPEPEPAVAAQAEPEPEPVSIAKPVAEPAEQASDFELEDDFVLPPAQAAQPQVQFSAPQPEIAARHEEIAAPTPPAAEPHAPAKGGLLGGLLSSLYRRNDGHKAPAKHAEPEAVPVVPAAPDLRPEPVTPQAVEAPVISMPDMPLPEAQPAEVQPEPAVAAELAPVEFAPTEASPADVVPPLSFEDRPLPPAPALGEPIEPLSESQVAAEPVAAPVPVPVPVPVSAPQPSAWAGTYLRRDADLVAMLSAREQLSDLLGELPLTLMVARAAQRHLELLGVSGLAVADANGQALDADLSGDLRSGLKSLSAAQPGGRAELLILDAGALDLDDLHYPHAITLSLGRVQHGKAALSLNGDLDVQQAARFLAEVSALLSAPVKLLV